MKVGMEFEVRGLVVCFCGDFLSPTAKEIRSLLQ